MHFGDVGNGPIAHVNSTICNSDFAPFRWWTVNNWLCNNIPFKFNIEFLLNIWTQTQNVAILGLEFATKTVWAVVKVICRVCYPDFGDIQVCVCSKWIHNTIWHSYNHKPCSNFSITTKIDLILATMQTCAHSDWLVMMFHSDLGHQNLRPNMYAYIQ